MIITSYIFTLSIIGIYICPLNLQPSNLLWLSWNSFLAALNVCTFVSLDPFQFCHLLELYGSQVSPLLRLYSVNCYRYLHPLLVLLDDIYITWGTLQAVKILDEPIFCQFYQKRKDKLRGCYAMIAVSQLTILGYFAVRLNAPSQHVILSVPLTFWEQVAVSRALYMLFYKEFCMCFLIHYIQCPVAAMLCDRVRRLQKLKKKRFGEFEQKDENKEAQEVLKEVKTLSLAVRELNRITSFPFLVHISTLVVNIILGGCFVILCNGGWPLLMNSVVILSYLAFLMAQSAQIQERVEELALLLSLSSSKKSSRVNSQSSQTISYNNVQTLSKTKQLMCRLSPYRREDQAVSSKWISQSKSFSSLNKNSSKFRNPPSDALANYKSDLAIKLFQMATIRCAFIAQLVFFILNYVVIITQTNT